MLAFGQSAFRWVPEVENDGAKNEDFRNPGNFIQLDQKLSLALNDCIPGDTRMLRQRINQKRTDERMQHQRNIAGRQILFTVYEWFKVAEKDRDMVDTNKLQQLKITNGELQKFIFKWDAIATQMRKVPDDQSLLTYFLLQIEKLPKIHEDRKSVV